jgi:uncharacterized coiled-coil DUF342 family protein
VPAIGRHNKPRRKEAFTHGPAASTVAAVREEHMPFKQNFADQLKTQSDLWKAQLKDYQERLEEAGEKARGDYKGAMAEMEQKAEEARKLADKVNGASEAAWQDMVTASQKAFVELQRGWVDAVSRFQ